MYILRFLHIFNGLTMKLKVSKLHTHLQLLQIIQKQKVDFKEIYLILQLLLMNIILVSWLDFGIYRRAHVFETLKLDFFLVKLLNGSLELGKELARAYFKI